ncbi:Hypothetical transmembrane protein [Flavobacterium branchiophilum]|uniref:Hypothetical transmembrane protein n=1 Tax=Flavobacterium branchiophilum (strain FL-15) TaxID=1034807 RepID=G2Z427_FLABF|nr:Hypothetical transmembrane protein [Flavobacterium branchiophilum FL-15]
MKKDTLFVPLLIIISYFFCINYIEECIRNYDLRFYQSKDNGIFSCFEISFVTIIWIYIDLFKNFILSFIFSLIYSIISFVIIYFLFMFFYKFNLDCIFLLYFFISLIPIIIAFFVRKNYLKNEFKTYRILYFLSYLFFIEIVMNLSMKSSLIEIIKIYFN